MESDPQLGASHDVVVIGGGLIGSSIALRLAQAKLRVLVLDRGDVLSEASGAAAGMLAPQGEMAEPDPFFELCMASRALYPSFAAEVESLSGEKVGYRDAGSLLVATDEREAAELDHIYGAQTKLRLPIERWEKQAIESVIPGISPAVRFGLFVPGDHWLDNERLTRATVRAAEQAGAKFIWSATAESFNIVRTRVEGLSASLGAGAAFAWNAAAESSNVRDDRVESLNVCLRRGEPAVTLSAGEFVLAAGCWSEQLAATAGIPIRMEPCRGQMMELESQTELPLVVRSGMHYLVPRSGNRMVAGTTAERAGFEKAVTSEGLRCIVEGISRFAPFVRQAQVRRAWAGLRPDTLDHLPVLGRAALSNLTFATGHFRNGILLAPVTALLIAELILKGAPSRSLAAYSPSRFLN